MLEQSEEIKQRDLRVEIEPGRHTQGGEDNREPQKTFGQGTRGLQYWGDHHRLSSLLLEEKKQKLVAYMITFSFLTSLFSLH